MASSFTCQPFAGDLYRLNMCSDPGGITLDGWAANNNCTIASVTNPFGPGKCIEITATATANPEIRYGSNSTNAIPVDPGEYVTIQAQVRSASVPRQARASVGWYQADGTTSAGAKAYGAYVTINPSGWTTVSLVDAVAPAGAVFARAFWGVDPVGAVGEKWYLDSACIELGMQGTLKPYFDQYTVPAKSSTEYIEYPVYYGASADRTAVAWNVAQEEEKIRPLFGPIAPIAYEVPSAVLTHQMLDDPSVTWQTQRKAQRRTGEFVLLFDTYDGAWAAAGYFAAPSTFLDPWTDPGVPAEAWSFDGDENGDQLIARWIVPQGQSVTIANVEELVPNSDRTQWLWRVTVPWREVS